LFRSFLEKALAGDTVRIARQYYRPLLEVRQHPFRYGPVIMEQVTLGVALFRPKHLVEVSRFELPLPRSWLIAAGIFRARCGILIFSMAGKPLLISGSERVRIAESGLRS